MKALVSGTLVLALALLACGGGGDSVDNRALRDRIAYLNDLEPVEWVEFEGGDVFVGFSERPPDLAMIVNSAVVAAGRAHGKSVHIYAIDGGAPGWRPGDGPLLCEASVRMGALQQSCM